MIKQFFLVVTTVLLLTIGVSANSSVFAQVQKDLQLVVIPFAPHQNLDFFFLHSEHPLSYLEVEGEPPVFIALITSEQKIEYENAGYMPTVIDENPGELRQYYVMSTSHHNHRAAPNIAEQLQDPAFKQQGLELAYQLTTYNTLLKVSPETSFSQLAIPALQPFNARQLRVDLVPPTGRTSIRVQPSSVPTTIAPATTTSKADQRWIAFLVFGAIGAFLFVSLKKKPQK